MPPARRDPVSHLLPDTLSLECLDVVHFVWHEEEQGVTL